MAGSSLIADPVLRYIFPMKADSPFLGRWQRTHDYDIWTMCRPASTPDLTLWEKHGEGVVRVPDNDSVMHIIHGGVPHHIVGLFGYWRTCESDVVWFRVKREQQVHYAMVLGGCPSEYGTDTISWVCPSCANVLTAIEIKTGRKGLARFWAQEAPTVERFNASAAERTCGRCGHEHPLAYTFRQPDAAPAPTIDLW